MNEVHFCNPPAYDEIGVKALYDKVLKQPNMVKFFPNKLPKGRQMDRSYMYNIWNTVHQDQVQAVIEYANEVRYGEKNERMQDESIKITDKWEQELKAMPFTSKQKGRMSHLLKTKSKIGVEQKERVTYEPFNFEKRWRGSDGRVIHVVSEQQPKEEEKTQTGDKKKIVPKVLSKDVTMQDGKWLIISIWNI